MQYGSLFLQTSLYDCPTHSFNEYNERRNQLKCQWTAATHLQSISTAHECRPSVDSSFHFLRETWNIDLYRILLVLIYWQLIQTFLNAVCTLLDKPNKIWLQILPYGYWLLNSDLELLSLQDLQKFVHCHKKVLFSLVFF